MARKRRRSNGVGASCVRQPDVESNSVDPIAVQSVIMAQLDDSASGDEEEMIAYASVDAAEKEAKILRVRAHCVQSHFHSHANSRHACRLHR